jgi:hypothetical protein
VAVEVQGDRDAGVAHLVWRSFTWAVIGGLARILHGTPEITNDVVFCPQQIPNNFRRLDQALASLMGNLMGNL